MILTEFLILKKLYDYKVNSGEAVYKEFLTCLDTFSSKNPRPRVNQNSSHAGFQPIISIL